MDDSPAYALDVYPDDALQFTLTRSSNNAESKSDGASRCIMTLRHTGKSEHHIAFRVKTTQPRRYLVRPNNGIVAPGETESVTILLVEKDKQALLQSFDRLGQSALDSKDKFLVQSFIVDDNFAKEYVLEKSKSGRVESSAFIELRNTVGNNEVSEIFDKKLGVHLVAAGGEDKMIPEQTLSDVRRKYDELVSFAVNLTAERDTLNNTLEQTKREHNREMVGPDICVSGIKDPAMWAITYEQLLEVRDQAGEMFNENFNLKTMRDINDMIIRPLCEENKTSYSLFKNIKGLKTDVFVTHSWDELFGEFTHAVVNTFQSKLVKPSLWICAFALNQAGDIETQLGTGETALDQSPFVRALKGAESYLIVRNSKKDLCARIWCVAEFVFAKEYGFIPDKTHISGPDTFANSTSSVYDADAWDEKDKDKILRELLNMHLRESIDDYMKQFRSFGTASGSTASKKISTEVGTASESTSPKKTSTEVGTASQSTSSNKLFTNVGTASGNTSSSQFRSFGTASGSNSSKKISPEVGTASGSISSKKTSTKAGTASGSTSSKKPSTKVGTASGNTSSKKTSTGMHLCCSNSNCILI